MKKKKKPYQPPSTEVVRVDPQRLLAGSPNVNAKSWVKAADEGDADVWTTSGSTSGITASGWNQSTSGDNDTWQ
jgi:hypothetical protein